MPRAALSWSLQSRFAPRFAWLDGEVSLSDKSVQVRLSRIMPGRGKVLEVDVGAVHPPPEPLCGQQGVDAGRPHSDVQTRDLGAIGTGGRVRVEEVLDPEEVVHPARQCTHV